MQSREDPIIDAHGIYKRYYIGQPNELEILHGIDIQIYPGEFVAIVGASGSGKSTLMNILGVLDKPTEGEYYLDGIDVGQSDDTELSTIRNQKIGFVFQTYNLISRQSAIKNVELPMLYAGMGRGARVRRAKELMETAFEYFDKWNAIPDGELLDAGVAEIAASMKVKKGTDILILQTKEKAVCSAYGIFKGNKGDIMYSGMTAHRHARIRQCSVPKSIKNTVDNRIVPTAPQQ